MANKQDLVKTQLTEKGIKEYETLLNTLIGDYNKEESKLIGKVTRIWGFGDIPIKDKDSLLEWIKCLGFLLGRNLKETLVTDLTKGEKKSVIMMGEN